MKQILGGTVSSRDFKTKQRTMKVRGEDFRQAQRDPEVRNFLEEAIEEEKRLEHEGLIHY